MEGSRIHLFDGAEAGGVSVIGRGEYGRCVSPRTRRTASSLGEVESGFMALRGGV
jgi:hypothetical protein